MFLLEWAATGDSELETQSSPGGQWAFLFLSLSFSLSLSHTHTFSLSVFLLPINCPSLISPSLP